VPTPRHDSVNPRPRAACAGAPRPRRAWSRGEEIANSASHGAAFLAALVAVPVLIANAARRGGVIDVIGAGVFGATVLLLYFCSSLYHALPAGPAKRRLLLLDHTAIFLLIAGTYTPLLLGVLGGPLGWTLLALVWGLALTGVGLKAAGLLRSPVPATCLYVGLGWIVLLGGKATWVLLPRPGAIWLVAGGIAYTAGIALFAAVRVPYAHLGWHLCVIAGTACHYVAVLRSAG